MTATGAAWDAEIDARRSLTITVRCDDRGYNAAVRQAMIATGQPLHRGECDEPAEILAITVANDAIGTERHQTGRRGFFARRHKHLYSETADLLSPRHAARKHRSEAA